MSPPTDFPASGPELRLFIVLFVIGFALSLLSYLIDSRTLRLAGIVLVLAAGGVFLVAALRFG